MCSEKFKIFSQDFFGKFKNGQKKCPKIENAKTVSQKTLVCDHNLILW
jgi:hypothetical protein